VVYEAPSPVPSLLPCTYPKLDPTGRSVELGDASSMAVYPQTDLLGPSEGTALVDGLDLYKAPAAARGRLGYMAQKF
jgi:hypothetical protein